MALCLFAICQERNHCHLIALFMKSPLTFIVICIFGFSYHLHISQEDHSLSPDTLHIACCINLKFYIVHWEFHIFFCIFVFSHFFFFFQLNYIQPCNESENQWEEGCLICTCINQEQNISIPIGAGAND